MYGQIDETTTTGTRVLLSSLGGPASSSGSIVGLSGLALARFSLWFSANGIVYKRTLDGRSVERIGPAPGAIELDVTDDGIIRYSTGTADYELTASGSDQRIAGGGDVPWSDQGTPHRATAEALKPMRLAATGDDAFDFVNENVLYRVVNGVATEIDGVDSFFNGELAHGTGNVLYGICNWAICRIDGTRVTQLFSLVGRFTKAVSGDFIAPCGLAVGPSGTFYLSYSDQSSRGHAGVLELSQSGQVERLIATRTTSS